MRKVYLDNLRIGLILCLFPVHTFMIWNNYGTKFYIWGGENRLLSTLILLVNPWFMSVLFVIAGISAKHSLERRKTAVFIKERIQKLLIPFLSGLVFVVPIQTLIARKFFFGYNGSILENYKYFFTHVTDLSGYDGCFTPGHLWFILFLWIISILALIVIKYIPYKKMTRKLESLNLLEIILLFIPVWLFYYIGNFGGYSLGKDFILYLIGYYVFSNEKIIDQLIEHKKIIITLFVVSEITLMASYYQFSYYGDFVVNFVGWIGVLACFMIGKDKENRKTKGTEYFNNCSFPVYILHQPILVVLGYYVLPTINSLFWQIILIGLGSFLLTIFCYEILRKIPYIRNLFGIK